LPLSLCLCSSSQRIVCSTFVWFLREKRLFISLLVSISVKFFQRLLRFGLRVFE
jgi:hypothetical protein